MHPRTFPFLLPLVLCALRSLSSLPAGLFAVLPPKIPVSAWVRARLLTVLVTPCFRLNAQDVHFKLNCFEQVFIQESVIIASQAQRNFFFNLSIRSVFGKEAFIRVNTAFSIYGTNLEMFDIKCGGSSRLCLGSLVILIYI